MPMFLLASAQTESLMLQLDRYEELCGQCLELKARSAAGEDILKENAHALVEALVNLNRSLKSKESLMTVPQKKRFNALSQWFASGGTIEPEVVEDLVSVNVTDGRFPLNIPVPCCKSALKYLPDSQVERQRYDGDVFLLASMSLPNMSYGLMAGYQYLNYGGYASFRSNYHFAPSSYSCNSSGLLDGGGKFWASGVEKVSNMSVCVGVLYGFEQKVSLFAGAGYASRKLVWEDEIGRAHV